LSDLVASTAQAARMLKNVLHGDAIISIRHVTCFLNRSSATMRDCEQFLLKQPRPAGEIYNLVDNQPIY